MTQTATAAVTPLPEFLSAKFRFWSFVAMVLLVYVHGYTIEPRYLQPWTQPAEPLGFTSYFEYLFANGLLRFRIPMLFAISGFLFAMHDAQPHGARVKKRVRTLLLPYLLWSALHIGILFLMETDPTMRGWVANSGIAYTAENQLLVHDASLGQLVQRWIFAPLPYQLWFIRSLFMLNLLYPLLRWVINHPKGPKVFFIVVPLCWLFGYLLFFVQINSQLPYMLIGMLEGDSLLFFVLGIWLQKSAFNIQSPSPWLRPLPWALLALASALAKTWLAFEGQHLQIGEAVFALMAFLHKITIAGGLVAAWFGCDPLVRWCMARPWFVWLSAFSFIIYAFHAPLVAVLIDPSIRLFAGLPEPQLWAYLLLPLALIAASVLLGAGLRRFAPAVYSLATGGRGLGQ